MRFFLTLLLFILVPLPCDAQDVSFLLQQVYASAPVEVVPDPSGLSGRAARKYREQLQLQYEQEASSSQESIIEEGVSTAPMEIESEEIRNTDSPSSSAASEPQPDIQLPTTNTSPSNLQNPTPPAPVLDQKELDELTLEQLEEYADEASANIEEQISLLEEGFSITSTSTLGSPLPSVQRSAILRRTVRTVPQLKLFARALAESDDRLRKIEVSEDTVTVSYRRKAWLFGFIPLNYILETTVQGTDVTADQPWWHVLARDGVKDIQTSLEEDLSALEPPEDEGVSALLDRMQQVMHIVQEGNVQ